MNELSDLTIRHPRVAQALARYDVLPLALTARESTLLRLLDEARTNVQIGHSLPRSDKTVHSQLTRVYRTRSTGASGQTGADKWCVCKSVANHIGGIREESGNE